MRLSLSILHRKFIDKFAMPTKNTMTGAEKIDLQMEYDRAMRRFAGTRDEFIFMIGVQYALGQLGIAGDRPSIGRFTMRISETFRETMDAIIIHEKITSSK